MATEFHAFLKSDKQPTVAELSRALSSRGFAFSFSGDTALNERTDLGLTVDGNAHAVTVTTIEAGTPAWAELASGAHDRPDGETLLKVIKNCNRRITFSADGEAATWARDVARGASLLAVGAFENVQKGSLLFYGG